MRKVPWQLLEDETGQDFLEYAILGEAIVAVAAAVVSAFRNEPQNTFNWRIAQMRSIRNPSDSAPSC